MPISCFKILSGPTYDSGVLNWEACWVVLLRAHLVPNTVSVLRDPAFRLRTESESVTLPETQWAE